MNHEEIVHTKVPLGPSTPVIRRISWGAIFAGLIISMVVQLLLTTLGVAIGAATIDPLRERDPMSGIGVGAGIWLLLSSLISLFVGGWVAGRLAGVPRRIDGGLHGFITWGTATLLTLLLLTTAVGGLLGGAAGLLSRTMSTGQGSQIGRQAQAELQRRGIDTEAIRQEAREMVPQTGPPSEQAREAAQEAQRMQGGNIPSPQTAQNELITALDRMFSRGDGQINPADRNAVLGVLTSRFNMSQDEATRLVGRWEQTYQQRQAQAGQAEQKVRQAGQKAASGISQAAFWSFLALLLGAVVAYLGGLVGTPRPSDITGRAAQAPA